MNEKAKGRLWIGVLNANTVLSLLVLIGLVVDRYSHHAIAKWLTYWLP